MSKRTLVTHAGIAGFSVVVLAAMTVVTAGVERPPEFKPGFNLFSPAEDIKLGHDNAAEVEKQLPILHDAETERYMNDRKE